MELEPRTGMELEPRTPVFSLPFFFKKIIYVWRCWVFIAVQTSSGCGEQGPLSSCVCGLLIAVASLVEHGL